MNILKPVLPSSVRISNEIGSLNVLSPNRQKLEVGIASFQSSSQQRLCSTAFPSPNKVKLNQLLPKQHYTNSIHSLVRTPVKGTLQIPLKDMNCTPINHLQIQPKLFDSKHSSISPSEPELAQKLFNEPQGIRIHTTDKIVYSSHLISKIPTELYRANTDINNFNSKYMDNPPLHSSVVRSVWLSKGTLNPTRSEIIFTPKPPKKTQLKLEGKFVPKRKIASSPVPFPPKVNFVQQISSNKIQLQPRFIVAFEPKKRIFSDHKQLPWLRNSLQRPLRQHFYSERIPATDAHFSLIKSRRKRLSIFGRYRAKSSSPRLYDSIQSYKCKSTEHTTQRKPIFGQNRQKSVKKKVVTSQIHELPVKVFINGKQVQRNLPINSKISNNKLYQFKNSPPFGKTRTRFAQDQFGLKISEQQKTVASRLQFSVRKNYKIWHYGPISKQTQKSPEITIYSNSLISPFLRPNDLSQDNDPNIQISSIIEKIESKRNSRYYDIEQEEKKQINQINNSLHYKEEQKRIADEELVLAQHRKSDVFNPYRTQNLDSPQNRRADKQLLTSGKGNRYSQTFNANEWDQLDGSGNTFPAIPTFRNCNLSDKASNSPTKSRKGIEYEVINDILVSRRSSLGRYPVFAPTDAQASKKALQQITFEGLNHQQLEKPTTSFISQESQNILSRNTTIALIIIAVTMFISQALLF